MPDFTADNLNVRSGTASIRIVEAFRSGAAFAQAATFEVLGIGEIKLENEVLENEEDPTNVEVNAGSVEIELEDTAQFEDGEYFSLIEHFEDVASSAFPMTIQLEVTRDGETLDFLFEFNFSDIDESFIERKLTIDAASVFKEVDNTGEFLPWARSLPDPRDTPNDTVDRFRLGRADLGTIDLVRPLSLIVNGLEEQYGTADGVLVSSPFLEWESATDGNLEFGLFMETSDGSGEWPFTITGLSKLQVIANVAALSGSFYGYAFGTPYFKDRGHAPPEYSQNIDWGTVEDFEVVQRRNYNIRQINVSALVRGGNNINPDGSNSGYGNWNEDYLEVVTRSTGVSINLESDDPQVLSVAFSKKNLIVARYRADGPDLALDPNDAGADFVWKQVGSSVETTQSQYNQQISFLVNDGSENYAKALGALNPLRIEVTGWDIRNLKPWHTCRFSGNNTPPLILGKEFGISVIEYDIENDKYTAELYEI